VNQFLKKLKEPFPEQADWRTHIRELIGISVFVTLFLYLIQPFGLNDYPHNLFLFCVGFGLLTFFAAVAFECISRFVFKFQRDAPTWTLWKWILNALVLIVFIAVANYLFLIYMMGWSGFYWKMMGYMLFSTVIVGIFPIVFSGMLIQMRAYKNNQVQAAVLQAVVKSKPENSQSITITSKNEKQTLELNLETILYIESQQNYVLICAFKEGQIEKTRFRNTVKIISEQLENTNILRCHRSFLVNTNAIEKVSGNAQGLKLALKNLPDYEVPVSRKYIPILKSVLEK
jgi:hypothetical protein